MPPERKGPQRHIRNQTQAHGIIQQGDKLFRRLIGIQRRLVRISFGQIPIAVAVNRPIFLEDQGMGRRHLLHAFPNGLRSQDIPHGKVMSDGPGIDLRHEGRIGRHCLDFGCENHSPVGRPGPKKGFLPETVAGKDQPSLMCIPTRRRRTFR